jgi:hypothetical protein
METLAAYHRIGASMGWEWRVGGSHARKLVVLKETEALPEVSKPTARVC